MSISKENVAPVTSAASYSSQVVKGLDWKQKKEDIFTIVILGDSCLGEALQ